jgi:hypothetical protein
LPLPKAPITRWLITIISHAAFSGADYIAWQVRQFFSFASKYHRVYKNGSTI